MSGMLATLFRCEETDRYDKEEKENRKEKKPLQRSCHDTVIPGKDGQFVKPGDKIPPGGGIARDKDPKGEDRKGVH